MKIVQIVNSITKGGAERLVADLHERYIAFGHESSVIAILGEENLDPEDGIHCLGCASLYSFQAYSRLTRLFRSKAFSDSDVVHVHLFPALLIAPRALRKAGWKGKLIASEHSTSNRRRNTLWGKIADKSTYKPYKNIVCVSSAVKDSLDNWQPSINDKTIVIPNGARLELFNPACRDSFHDPIRILSVGRLTPAKNYKKALEAIALLKSKGTDSFRFVWSIAGDGKLKDELLAYMKELNILAEVKFLGERDDVPKLLAESDLFFIPSLWEGFGIAAVEAMATGLPVVASKVPGLSEVVGNQAGILVDPNSVESIAEGLSTLLANPDRALKMGGYAPKQASQFSLDKCVSSHISLFQN